MTDKVRKLLHGLFALTVVTALVGWLFFDRDPAALQHVLLATTAASGIGEASNVGKRATYNSSAKEAER